LLLQQPNATVEPTFDRALGYSHDRRDLRLLHSLEVAKQNHVSDGLWNLGERRHEVGPPDPLVLVSAGRLKSRRFWQIIVRLDPGRCRMSQAPATITGQIESDGKEPRFEAPVRIETPARAERRKKAS
jgi:hypothetical protein